MKFHALFALFLGMKKNMKVLSAANMVVVAEDSYKLSYDVASGSEVKPCIKINKTLVLCRFSGNE